MSKEVANTDDIAPNVAPGIDLEIENELLATINTAIEDTTLETDPNEGDYSSCTGFDRFGPETPAELAEKGRREQLDYEKAVREKLEWDGTYHPGVDGSDLVQKVNNHLVVSQDWFENDKSLKLWRDSALLQELCHNCGWTAADQTSPYGYTSRMKFRYMKGEAGLWEAGPKWFVRDEINNDWNGPANDYKAQRLIREKAPEVPLVEMHRFGEKEDKYALTVMSRAKGVQLSEIEKKLTREQKDILGKDLARYINQWRKITAPRMQTADGKPLRDSIFRCDFGPCQDVPFDPRQWLEKVCLQFRKTLLYKKWRADNNPKGPFPENWITEVDEKLTKLTSFLLNEGGLLDEEFVFTHGDLHSQNMFVFEETPGIYKISAIIDWELAGYCPWWVEWYYDRTGLIRKENLDMVMTKEHITTYFKNIDELDEVMYDMAVKGEYLFKHTPNDENNWYGRPFCKCQPFCTRYRSDDTFALGHPHEVTFDVVEDYPDKDIEFHKMWNNLIQKEDRPNSLTKQYTDEGVIREA